MARTINKVELLGRVGTDPEMQYTPNGTYRTEIHASEVVFLDSRNGNGNGNGGQVNDGDASDVEETVAASPF